MCELMMIDDNPIEHLIMQKMLGRYELFKNATHSLDGGLTLQSLKANRSKPKQLPDIIFLDLHMPLFSGWQFLEEFNELYPSITKNIDIYIVSSSVCGKERIKAMSYPFVKNFYQKPIKREQLELLYLSYLNTDRIAG